jgi:ADP-ribose pyrophosphatase
MERFGQPIRLPVSYHSPIFVAISPHALPTGKTGLTMSNSDELLSTRRFRVVRRKYRTKDGAEHEREVILHPGAVAILPLVDENHVCLIRNQRVAVEATLLELPAGTLEPDEDPLAAAARELEEETGWRAAQFEHLASFWMSPGILRERMHLFVARELTRGELQLDAGERIEPLVIPWTEAIELARSGAIEDAKTLVGLLFYERFRGTGEPHPR